MSRQQVVEKRLTAYLRAKEFTRLAIIEREKHARLKKGYRPFDAPLIEWIENYIAENAPHLLGGRI